MRTALHGEGSFQMTAQSVVRFFQGLGWLKPEQSAVRRAPDAMLDELGKRMRERRPRNLDESSGDPNGPKVRRRSA